MKSPNSRYDVFISYSRRDYIDENKVIIPNNIVSQIKDALKKADISYWFDEDGLYCGDAWAEKLAERIEECSIFLFISTSNSNEAEWTSKEIATAHMFKKKIIPFRVDESVYNKSVIIYIANLDFIDYYTNPTLAMARLVDNISKYIKDKKEADEKLLAKKRKEEDEARKLADAEQNALIEDVETACSDIEEFELRSVHTRKKATSKVKKIKSVEHRDRLTNLIQSSGSISTESFALKEEKINMLNEISTLKTEVSNILKENIEAKQTIRKYNEELTNSAQQITSLQDKCASFDKKRKSRKIVNIATYAIFIFLFISSVLGFIYSSYWHNYAYEQKTFLEDISYTIPIIIQDIKIGRLIESEPSDSLGLQKYKTIYDETKLQEGKMSLLPQIKFISPKDQEVTLGYKLFDKEGKLCQHAETAPKGYTFIKKYNISKGRDMEIELADYFTLWEFGTYKFEIWCQNELLKSKEFNIKTNNRVITYLDNNSRWTRDEIEKYSAKKGLWDALNEYRFDDILSYEPHLSKSEIYNRIYNIIRENRKYLTSDFGTYCDNKDQTITINSYISSVSKSIARRKDRSNTFLKSPR